MTKQAHDKIAEGLNEAKIIAPYVQEMAMMIEESETLKTEIAALKATLKTIRKALGCDDGSNAELNLQGALIDMQHSGVMDSVCEHTIQAVLRQLQAAQAAAEEHEI